MCIELTVEIAYRISKNDFELSKNLCEHFAKPTKNIFQIVEAFFLWHMKHIQYIHTLYGSLIF